jgi:glutathione S-transferase
MGSQIVAMEVRAAAPSVQKLAEFTDRTMEVRAAAPCVPASLAGLLQEAGISEHEALGFKQIFVDPSKNCLAQSGAILRYAGRKNNMYPDEHQLVVDGVLECISDFWAEAIKVFGWKSGSVSLFDPRKAVPMGLSLSAQQQAEAVAAVQTKLLPYRFKQLDRTLELEEKRLRHGAGATGDRQPYAVGSTLTIADVALYAFVNQISRGVWATESAGGVTLDVIAGCPWVITSVRHMATIHEKHLRGEDVSGEIPDADVFFKGLGSGSCPSCPNCRRNLLTILDEMANEHPKPDEADCVGEAGSGLPTKSARKVPVFSYLDKNVKGEALRLALAASLGPDGFTDERVDYRIVAVTRDADYATRSTHGKYATGSPDMPKLPFSQVPTLSPWGASPNQGFQTTYAQSGAILRWAGRQGDGSLYPLEDPVQCLRVDTVVETIAELWPEMVKGGYGTVLLREPRSGQCNMVSIRNTPKFYARIEEIFVLYRNRFRTLDQMLERSGANSASPFVCGAQLTIADISLYAMSAQIMNNQWMGNGVSRDIFDGLRNITRLIAAVHEDPRIQAWNNSSGEYYMLSWRPTVGDHVKEIDEKQDLDEEKYPSKM